MVYSLEKDTLKLNVVRDWSLITGRGGGLQNGRGGHEKFYPYEKGGGGTIRFVVVFMQKLEVLAI